jgi:glyoxylase-like metal-dependent hydrolase (beta-lactamase superfamily II)
MCQEILPNLFRLRIPLPETPLKYLNSYVIRDSDKSMIIDTGLNRKECLEAMMAGLRRVGIDLEKSDIFVTHLHADHFGSVAKLATDTSNIYFSRPEKELLESWEGFEAMINYAGKNGYPENELRSAVDKHPGAKYGSDCIPEMKVIDDGDEIHVGDYDFKCVVTPGHTMGHICLYEPSRKILVSGDHILIDITPNIQCWSDTQNPLKHYLTSLDKVAGLQVDLILPGHRRLIENHNTRIEELKQHHVHRLNEVLTILEGGPLNPFQVASRMTWDIQAASWDHFPVEQRWFATGEAISHLRYLEEEGKLACNNSDKIKLYSLISPRVSGSGFNVPG